ncbi:MAG: response regulator transcription factor [Filimonas sp.]|nr:response regulator transcription factor [Filimonas sp.]
MMEILLADDHSIVRYGLKSIIKSLYHDVSIVESENFDDVIRLLDQKKFHLVVLDINMPGGNSLNMIGAIRLKQPDVRILVFTGFNDQILAFRYLQAGANGFLVKNFSEKEVERAIKTVMDDDIYVSESVKQNFLHNIGGKKKLVNPLQDLSDRETEVMQLLMQGKSNSEISKILSLEATTVSTYKNRLFEKLDVKNVIELIDKHKIFSTSL